MLRGWFARWGLPAELRLDNGAPWGSWSGWPPDVALWLVGLAIGLRWNRPGHKQGNAVVERAHGVCQRWVEPGACQDRAELQARLDSFTALQRERYPHRGAPSRLVAWPALAVGGRPYDPATEAQHCDARRVWAWLGERVWQRRVDKAGQISLANRPLAVGKAWARQDVTVRLEAAADAPFWLVHDGQGALLCRRPAPELAADRIAALDVSRRRARVKPCARHGG